MAKENGLLGYRWHGNSKSRDYLSYTIPWQNLLLPTLRKIFSHEYYKAVIQNSVNN
jgi:hypothetical protein